MRRETHWGLAMFSRLKVSFCIVVVKADQFFSILFLLPHGIFFFIVGWIVH